jgi:hypothetical protein
VTPVQLTLISKPGCHLCDEARLVVTQVIESLPEGSSVSLEELSIIDDEELNRKHWDEIPVLKINGAIHNIWRIDPVRLAVAIGKASE